MQGDFGGRLRGTYREARQRARQAQLPDATQSGIEWKAQLIVTFSGACTSIACSRQLAIA